MSKRRKAFRFLKLVEDLLRAFREWVEYFTPEWDKEDLEKKAEKERVTDPVVNKDLDNSTL